eukprot:CAMPEP_0172203232 /NCGR_PEP_ID=MMETSP1050-20130122/31153_1 /TAXON_ID=233186 /ORGANISM="Cryptomonas curvata, Strain CCAP979/52" /LENGTH=81 /DNA_ID=CAMNT_0012881391 /DNA_START=440 /DNA_END=681 /DNA_ORIENTATION=+
MSNDDEILRKIRRIANTKGRQSNSRKKCHSHNKVQTSWMHAEEGVAPPTCLLQSEGETSLSASQDSDALSSHREWSDALNA